MKQRVSSVGFTNIYINALNIDFHCQEFVYKYQIATPPQEPLCSDDLSPNEPKTLIEDILEMCLYK